MVSSDSSKGFSRDFAKDTSAPARVARSLSGLAALLTVLLVVAVTGCNDPDKFKDLGYTPPKANKPWTGAFTPGDTVEDVGYNPKQPIAEFSHALHAGQNKIPCQYCHSGARRSAVAGIPPMNTCMGCHKLVATDKDPIKFLKEKYDAKDPIRWTKVHDMPDFVRFTHQPHVLAGVECATCHGDMTKQTTAVQVAPLQMGWCVDCHMNNNASISCQTCHY